MGYADVCLTISVYLLIPLNSKKESIKLNKTPNINKHGRFNIKTWRVQTQELAWRFYAWVQFPVEGGSMLVYITERDRALWVSFYREDSAPGYIHSVSQPNSHSLYHHPHKIPPKNKRSSVLLQTNSKAEESRRTIFLTEDFSFTFLEEIIHIGAGERSVLTFCWVFLQGNVCRGTQRDFPNTGPRHCQKETRLPEKLQSRGERNRVRNVTLRNLRLVT